MEIIVIYVNHDLVGVNIRYLRLTVDDLSCCLRLHDVIFGLGSDVGTPDRLPEHFVFLDMFCHFYVLVLFLLVFP